MTVPDYSVPESTVQKTYLPGAHLFEQLDRLMLRAEGLPEWQGDTLTHGAERIEGRRLALIDWTARHDVPRWYRFSGVNELAPLFRTPPQPDPRGRRLAILTCWAMLTHHPALQGEEEEFLNGLLSALGEEPHIYRGLERAACVQLQHLDGRVSSLDTPSGLAWGASLDEQLGRRVITRSLWTGHGEQPVQITSHLMSGLEQLDWRESVRDDAQLRQQHWRHLYHGDRLSMTRAPTRWTLTDDQRVFRVKHGDRDGLLDPNRS